MKQKKNKLYAFMLVFTLGACGEKIPNISGIYINNNHKFEISPVEGSEGKYAVAEYFDNSKYSFAEGVVAFDQEKRKFCTEGAMPVCFEYSNTEGIRPDGKSFFYKKQE